MSEYVEKAIKLRESTDPKYNCCQAVVFAFEDLLKFDRESIYWATKNYNGGLKMGSTCGAIVGGLAVLGMAKIKEPEIVNKLQIRVRENHDGNTNCAQLLKVMVEKGEEKKTHCNNMVYECVSIVEQILTEEGIIK